MPTKNFFQLSLAPTCSSSFLYTTNKTPSQHATGMLLNCRTLQTTHDGMASGLCRHLRHLRHWMHDSMPSSPCEHLEHLGHLGHLGYLGIIGNLNTLNPYSLDTTPIDSYCRAFITEMNPEDGGVSEGYYIDNLLNHLSIATPLLPIERHIRQTALDGHGSPLVGETYIKWIDTQMGMTHLSPLLTDS
jgi:hypothetical protein